MECLVEREEKPEDESEDTSEILPTRPFTVLDPQDQEIGEFYLVQKKSIDGSWNSKIVKRSVEYLRMLSVPPIYMNN